MSTKDDMKALLERQKSDPALSSGGGLEPKTRKGAFKVSSASLKFFKTSPDIDGPRDIMFKKVVKYIDDIPRDELPKIWKAKNMADAQDLISDKPKRAFQMWMMNVGKVAPKIKKRLSAVPQNAALMYYVFMTRVVGTMMADQIFKRHFATDSDHAGAMKGKKGKEAKQKKFDTKAYNAAQARKESVIGPMEAILEAKKMSKRAVEKTYDKLFKEMGSNIQFNIMDLGKMHKEVVTAMHAGEDPAEAMAAAIKKYRHN